MLFAISVDDLGRAILDDEIYGDVIAVIEAKDWQEARGEALKQEAMNAFSYVSGKGWVSWKATSAQGMGRQATQLHRPGSWALL